MVDYFWFHLKYWYLVLSNYYYSINGSTYLVLQFTTSRWQILGLFRLSPGLGDVLLFLVDEPFLVFNGDAPGLEFFLLLFVGFLKSSLRFVDPSSRGWRVLAGNLIGLMCNLGPVQLGTLYFDKKRYLW